jgi:hypothetical protein
MSKRKKLRLIILVFLGVIIIYDVATLFYHFYGWRFEYDYTGWKDVTIEKVGSFKVPGEWVETRVGNAIYFTDRIMEDEDHIIYLVGSAITYENDEYVPVYKRFGDIEYIKTVSSQIHSNSSDWGKSEYRVGNDVVTKKYVSFQKSGAFLAWDDLVDDETMIMIAKSFILE